MSLEELKAFYKKRSKKPNLYTYDEDGNLIEREAKKDGAIIKTIALPKYRKPTFEEIDELETKRMELIAIATKEFEDSRKELRELTSRPNTPISEIMRLNRKVEKADIYLQSVRFPLKAVKEEFGVLIKNIDFTKPYEKRKYPYDLYILTQRAFSLQDQYVRIGEAAKKPLISVAEAKMSQNNTVILFSEPNTNEYGFLSLKWVVEIDFNRIIYNSVQQALYAEIAKSFNDQENLKKIMLAESPEEVTYQVSDVPGDVDTNEIKWNDLVKKLLYDINIAKFNQYPELSSRLLETTTSVLGAYIPNDNLIGIGISIDNIQSKNPINWTGQNLLGKALMDIRDKIRIAKTVENPISRPIRRRPKPAVAPPVVDSNTMV